MSVKVGEVGHPVDGRFQKARVEAQRIVEGVVKFKVSGTV